MPLTLATTTPCEPGSKALAQPEIFASLQGEGPSTGKPCAFVRLSRCNLACVWCDTAYTWHFEGDSRPHRDGVTYDRAANQVTLSEEDTAARIAALAMPRVVITGGEPLLQGPALARMLAHLDTLVRSRESGSLPAADGGPRLRGDSLTIEIETNGTVDPAAALDIHVDQYTVSPKLAHSGNPAELALIPKMLDRWATDERAIFKFVIARPADVDEVLALARRHGILPQRIWLMPEGTDTATLKGRESWLAQLCLDHRLTLSGRLHIELFGDTRGP
jgi:organic radical activating enzyme